MQIQEIVREDFEEIYALVRTTFPQEECYPYAYHQKAFQREDLFGRKYIVDGEIKAFTTGFRQKGYLFLDYFAVDKNLRGHGLGGQFFKQVIESANCPVIIEVELPETDIAKRRIGFYQRLGFQLNTFTYRMPLISDGFGDTPLYIMSYPNPIPDNDCQALVNDIYQNVYRVKK